MYNTVEKRSHTIIAQSEENMGKQYKLGIYLVSFVIILIGSFIGSFITALLSQLVNLSDYQKILPSVVVSTLFIGYSLSHAEKERFAITEEIKRFSINTNLTSEERAKLFRYLDEL